jgi:hypothetical protein
MESKFGITYTISFYKLVSLFTKKEIKTRRKAPYSQNENINPNFAKF